MLLDGPRKHRNIDKLPKGLVDTITSMAVDNIWPDDFKGEKAGRPRYKDMVSYVQQRGYSISVHAVGRFCRRLRTLAKMKNSAQLVKEAMQLPGTKDLRDLARATRDCTQVAIAADKYIRERIQENIASASKQIGVIAKKKNIDPETLKAIREQVYGIVDDHLGYTRSPQKQCLSGSND